jgi:hypothetical protein
MGKFDKSGNNLLLIRFLCLFAVGTLPFLGGCFRYGFTGASIPKGVKTIYIPFFPNNSSSSVSDISNKLKQVLVNRFVKKSPLRLAKNQSGADAILVGSINGFSDKPFSISGNSQSSQNQVTVQVKAKFKFSDKKKAEWNKIFSGSATYDPTKNPIQGETNAAIKALDQIANNMFNDAVSGW